MDNENNNQYYTPQQDFQQSYQMPQGNGYMPPVVEQKANVGLAILSYLIPIVGIVLYFTKKNDQKKAAKVYGKCALASIIINAVIGTAISVISGVAAARLANEAAKDPEAFQQYLDDYNLDDYNLEGYDLGDITEPQAE